MFFKSHLNPETLVISYVKPLKDVDLVVGEHRKFLELHYANGNFLMSGRQEPRTGGIIIAKAERKTDIQSIIEGDPFFKAKVAEYNIIEFIPTMAADNLAYLLSNH